MKCGKNFHVNFVNGGQDLLNGDSDAFALFVEGLTLLAVAPIQIRK